MTDLVCRQAVINALENTDCELTESDWNELTDAVMRVPSIQPKRETGRWIHHTDWERDGEAPYECDQCGRCFDYKMRFCGFCGAKMEIENATDRISKLPSVQPEPQTERWDRLLELKLRYCPSCTDEHSDEKIFDFIKELIFELE